MAEKQQLRRHPRHPVRTRIELTWTDDHGAAAGVRGWCVEVSEEGMRLELADPIPVRTYVCFRDAKLKLEGSGSVRYCLRRGLKHFVGIEFSGGLKWPGKMPQD